MIKDHRIAVIVPCYRVKSQILGVLRAMPTEVDLIFCVDDRCPDASGDFIVAECRDPRVTVLRHESNRGVGGAVKTGYTAALAAGADIMVKVDGDGQMDPGLAPLFCRPIAEGIADYVKGNRFHNLEDATSMPLMRLVGNAGLSFITKLSSGYYNIVDPTNGYTALHRAALQELPLGKIADRYFFESDILFRLGIARAVVLDMPMKAVYAGETSSLKIGKVLFEFALKHLRNCAKRIGYLYFLRDFNVGSVNLLVALAALAFGLGFGSWRWAISLSQGVEATAGTVMLSALPVIIGVQCLLSFLQQDVASVPRLPLSRIRAIR